MFNIFFITFKGVFRDRVFQGILIIAASFLAIPSISSLSMRQVTELSTTLSLSLLSFIMLLLSVFLGGTSLWKDIERRYTFSALGLPLTRGEYLLGKFAGIAGFLFLTALLLGTISCAVIWYVSGAYPPNRPVVWPNVFLALLFDSFKYILLVSFAFLFSTVSTSFFLPIFGTISTFMVGNVTQEVYDYIHSQSGQSFSPLFKKSVDLLYYILPNFSAFDLKVNAIYGIRLVPAGLALTFCYFIVYSTMILSFSTLIFSKREMQ